MLVDAKGRLFGIINLFDLLIVSLAFVAVPVFIFISGAMDKTPQLIKPQWVKVKVVSFALPDHVKFFKSKEVLRDRFGNVDLKITDVKIMEDDNDTKRLKESIIFQTSVRKDGRIIINPSFEHKVPVYMDLEVLCTRSGPDEPWYFRRKPLLISLDIGFIIDTRNYRITVYPLEIEGV